MLVFFNITSYKLICSGVYGCSILDSSECKENNVDPNTYNEEYLKEAYREAYERIKAAEEIDLY